MRSLIVLAALLSGCSAGSYDNHDLELLTRYRAKDLCSCRFVMKRDAEYCIAWTVAAPDLATVHIDEEAKAVETSALFFWSGRARWVSERQGCVLE